MWNPYDNLPAKLQRKLQISSVLMVFFVWLAISSAEIVGPGKLPTPMSIIKAFMYLTWDSGQSLLFDATMASVSRVVAASVFVCLIGVPIGVFMGAFPRVNAFLSPLVDPFRSAPIVAVMPIFVMWFGIGESMKIIFLFFGAVVFLIPMVRDAIQSVPSIYWVSSVDLGATTYETIKLSLIPIAMPRIADAVISSISLQWTYITAAEYVNAEQGLGKLIQDARRSSALDQVCVGIFVIIALSLLTYSLLNGLKKKLYPWELV